MPPSVSADRTAQQINNCPLPSRIFRGRQAILDKMYEFFNQDIGRQHIYVLHGLGGAGKTQIGLKFVNNSSHFTEKFFLDGSTAETIDTGLKNIVSMKNVGNSSQDALRWLANKEEDWLVFYDNTDDPKLNLNSFLPQCTHGNIIITTRNPGLCVYAGANSAVSDMEETDAVELLLKSAAQESSSANTKIAAEIVKEMCYLPLAIVQAGAFISQSGALNRYLDIYKSNRAQLLSEKPAQSHDNYEWTVYTTWQMSFDKLSLLSATFLQLCSLLHRDGISEEIFSRAAAYTFPSFGEWDTLCFMKVTNEIKAYSLMSFDPERKLFSIHPLVHSWSRTTITDQQSYHPIMAAIMGMSIAKIPDGQQQLASVRLISHVDSLRHGNQQAVVDFGAQYGMIYYYAGRSEEAKGLYLAVLEWRKQVLSDHHPDTLWVMGNLASTYHNLGDFHKAKELGVVVLEKRKQVLGDDHPDTLRAMGNLASTYAKLGQFYMAEELEVVVLAKRKQVLGDDHPNTLRAMGNLASTYRDLGKFHKAEELDVVVLEKRKQVLGDDHPDTLRAMGNLASTYRELGKFHTAEELEVVVLEKRKQVLGNDHPDTLLAMGNLASTYNYLGQFQQAEELEVVVLEKRRQVLGDDRPDTLRAMGNLGWTYHQLGQFQKAEELEFVVLEKRKKLLGDNHPDTLQTVRNLASTYRCLGKLFETEELENSLTIARKHRDIL
ncbi:P-loop containing nucleoside triphosphate hydrolase protein [Mycena leptocephala]|nr:P-loop containing nucleoside triphosphate hydrolase protein [Mycena leptocephala]